MLGNLKEKLDKMTHKVDVLTDIVELQQRKLESLSTLSKYLYQVLQENGLHKLLI